MIPAAATAVNTDVIIHMPSRNAARFRLALPFEHL